MIRITDLSFQFQQAGPPLFTGLSLHVARGERLALVGPSGSGKTTLIQLLAGLLPYSQGTIDIAGMRLPAGDDKAASAMRNRQIGIVFQNYNLLGRLTVAENLRLRLAIAGMSSESASLSAWLDRVGLANLLHVRANRLSGGQQQRIAAVRALITRPAVVLADEPTGNLDDAAAANIVSLLTDREVAPTVLVATHDPRVLGTFDRHHHLTPAERP